MSLVCYTFIVQYLEISFLVFSYKRGDEVTFLSTGLKALRVVLMGKRAYLIWQLALDRFIYYLNAGKCYYEHHPDRCRSGDSVEF